MSREALKPELLIFNCPITKEKFRDPVVAEDGYTYEREAIIKWVQDRNGTSPRTGKSLDVNRLVPNHLVKQFIDRQFEVMLQTRNYKFKLNDDIKQLDHLFVTFGKSVDAAEWTNKSDGPPIILLTINGARAEKEAMFYVEMSNHPNVVRTFGLVDNPDDEVMLVQERAPLGDLLHLLKKRDQPPNENILKEIFTQISDGMSFLAHNNIIHGDLACRNILVFWLNDGNPKEILVKVTDFGLSRASSLYKSVSSSTATTLNIIPYRYVAPEILQNPNTNEFYSEKSDMYSMGVLMWETYSTRGKQPWSEIKDDNEVIEKVVAGERLQRPVLCSKDMWSIIENTMLQQADDRPTFSFLHRQLIALKIEEPIVTTERSTVDLALKAIRSQNMSISLSEMGLAADDIKVIAEELKTNEFVQSLDLHQNELFDEGIKYVAEMLQTNQMIHKITLSNNSISSEGAISLALALETSQILTYLDISHNPLWDEGIHTICEAIKKSQTLTTLLINGTGISSIGIKSIADMLSDKNVILERLGIGNNQITDEGAEMIGKAMKINKTIVWLDMDSRFVTDKGAIALAKAIASHRKKIQYFFLMEHSPLSDKGWNALKSALRENATTNR